MPEKARLAASAYRCRVCSSLELVVANPDVVGGHVAPAQCLCVDKSYYSCGGRMDELAPGEVVPLLRMLADHFEESQLLLYRHDTTVR